MEGLDAVLWRATNGVAGLAKRIRMKLREKEGKHPSRKVNPGRNNKPDVEGLQAHIDQLEAYIAQLKDMFTLTKRERSTLLMALHPDRTPTVEQKTKAMQIFNDIKFFDPPSKSAS